MEWRLSSRGKPSPEEALACGIAVDQKNLETFECEAGGKIDCGGGFADSAFLIDDAENLAHGISD